MLDRIESLPVAKIKNNTGQIEGLPKNPRFIRDERYEAQKQSLIDDPEMTSLREIIVFPFEDHWVAVGGNMRLRAARDLKWKTFPCKILTADTPIEKLKAYAMKDNISYGQTDFDMVANEWDVDEVQGWGLEIPDMKEKSYKEPKEDTEEEEFAKKMLEDCLYPSNNLFEIPTLDIEKQARQVILPFSPWGADSRLRQGISTYHFYVDDYRFEAIFKDPVKVLTSGVRQIVEPNLSLYDTTPIAYGLHLIYKKRWISRYFQECNINIFADLNVSQKFYEYNRMGIPDGWDAFMTRGYNDRIEYLKMEIEIARQISGKKDPNLIVYGGGKKVQDVCAKNNLVYIEQFINDK
jgi:hypothetical protein